MRTPEFWNPGSNGGAQASLLAPLAWSYGVAGQIRRSFVTSRRVGVPVICVGNVTAGGGGKTPTALALAKLSDTAATKVTLPFVEDQLQAARKLMGDDFWSYGFEPNRRTLERFLEQHHAEGLSCRQLTPEELFHPATLESFKI